MKKRFFVVLLLTVFMASLIGGCSSEASKIDITKMTSKEITQLLVDIGFPIENIIDYTAETDPNSLLGRPGAYVSKNNFADIRLEQPGYTSDDPVGGTIEVFEKASDAKERYNYLTSMTSSPGIFFQYSYLYKNVYLRLDGALTPEQAEEYETAFISLQNGELPSPITFEVAPETVVVTQNGFFIRTPYESEPENFAVAAYCEFKNTSNEDIVVKKINVKAYDANDISLGEDTINSAPNFLKANEVGYAAVRDIYGIKVANKEDLSRLEFSVLVEKPTGSEFNLNCTDPEVIKASSYGDSDKNDNIIECIVENNTDKSIDAYDYELVVGLLDINGTLIGGAYTSGSTNSIDPNGKSKVQIDQIVLENDDLAEANKIDVKARLK